MKRLFVLLFVTVSLNAADAKKDDKKKDEKMHDKSQKRLGELNSTRLSIGYKMQRDKKVLAVLRWWANNSKASYETHKGLYETINDFDDILLNDYYESAIKKT